MKKKLMFLVIFIVSSAFAKTGWIAMDEVIQKTKEGKKILSALKKEKEEKENEIQKDMENLQKTYEELQKKSMVMNEKTKMEKLKALQEKDTALKQKAYMYNAKFSDKQTTQLESLYKKIQTIVQEYAKENKYSYIYEKKALIYQPDAEDITNKIIALYDKKHK